jgi:pectate lyase
VFQVFSESNLIERLTGDLLPDLLPDICNINFNNQELYLSSTEPTKSIEPIFLEMPDLLISRRKSSLNFRDLTNWNVVNLQQSDKDFDSGLTNKTAEILAGFSPFQEERSTSSSPAPQVLSNSSPAIPAFPGAQGFGALSVGGRGGRIIEVTNLQDSGPGSLRAAIEAEGPRIVVFRVSGTIQLQNTIDIENPYLTIAGQTAPGGGILLRGTDSTLLRIENGTHDIILRYLRLRNGSGEPNGFGHDNISINGGHNIILDHVSMSWSTDENASIWRKAQDSPVYNVTIQNSIFSEGIAGHSKGLIIGGETDFSDPSSPIEAWRDVKRISIHHNLFAHNSDRNPLVTSSKAHIINNVMYNWKGWISATTRGSVVDYINNYAKAGSISNLDRLFIYEDANLFQQDEPYYTPSIHTKGNVVESVQTDPNADNWNLWKLSLTHEPIPQSYRRANPLQQPPIPVDIQSAHEAYQSVLADVGANARLNCSGDWISNSDSVDVRILADVRRGEGSEKPISSPNQVGGYPELATGRLCADNDRDGMPNAWEYLHGLNRNDPTDGSADADGDGYTNVEEYLNGKT